jgi:hypothetical protein
MCLVGFYFLYVVVVSIRKGVLESGAGTLYRHRQPVWFWIHVAVGLVFGAGFLVFGGGQLGSWAWKTFGPAGPL